MNPRGLRTFFRCLLVTAFFLAGAGCAGIEEAAHPHGGQESVKRYPKNYVHPLTEVNLEKVIQENRGMRVVEANATTVHDYYRGSVQEKAEAETLLREGKFEEARAHFETSNRFLLVVLRYLSEDDPYRNIYGDVTIAFLPNLLMADNYLKLVRIFKTLGEEEEMREAERYGRGYLSRSLETVKTEWSDQVRIGFEQELLKK